MITCIVAEDFAELRDIYSNLLDHESGISVAGSAADGSELFSLLKSTEPDVLLLDIEMDSPNAGIEYCRRVTEEHPKIATIMLTCHEEEDKILSAFRAGAVNYILKTSSLSEIIEAVRNASEGKSKIHSHASEVIRKQLQRVREDKSAMMEIMKIVTSLTNTETIILSYLLAGKKQNQIASIRNIEVVTVKTHITGIHRKFGCRKTTEVVKRIRLSGLDEFITNQAEQFINS